jgi:hypothetical protein
MTALSVIVFLCGLVVGLYLLPITRCMKHAIRKLRRGICFRYVMGPFEVRDGTGSHFCVRCGHPYGYHRWQ